MQGVQPNLMQVHSKVNPTVLKGAYSAAYNELGVFWAAATLRSGQKNRSPCKEHRAASPLVGKQEQAAEGRGGEMPLTLSESKVPRLNLVHTPRHTWPPRKHQGIASYVFISLHPSPVPAQGVTLSKSQ